MEFFVHSPQSLGVAIRRRRRLLKKTQTEAGASFCIDQTTVSSVENGAAGTRLDTLFRLLAALDLDIVLRVKNPDKE